MAESYDIDYYRQINAEEGEQAERLAAVLIWKYQPKRVLDVGCATGLYLKPFLDRGIDGYGLDNAPATLADEVLQIPRQRLVMADITAEPITQRSDLTICLEVMEHIPAAGAAAGIKHLAATAPIIIFSAAQPGQGGLGHINCQPKEYWQQLFVAQGMERLSEDEFYLTTIMAAGYHMGWLRQNLMVFGRQPQQSANR